MSIYLYQIRDLMNELKAEIRSSKTGVKDEISTAERRLGNKIDKLIRDIRISNMINILTDPTQSISLSLTERALLESVVKSYVFSEVEDLLRENNLLGDYTSSLGR